MFIKLTEMWVDHIGQEHEGFVWHNTDNIGCFVRRNKNSGSILWLKYAINGKRICNVKETPEEILNKIKECEK